MAAGPRPVQRARDAGSRRYPRPPGPDSPGRTGANVIPYGWLTPHRGLLSWNAVVCGITMGARLWPGPQEPQAVLAAWVIRPEQPAILGRWRDRVLGASQGPHRSEHVDDRLGGQAGYRGGTDV